jgi:phosphoenolpyruvate synthase/pyruvate phosphate dikinase
VHSSAPSVPLWCSLSQSDELGVHLVGSRVKQLAELAQFSFLVPPTFVLTRQFFSEIFIHNNFEKVFYDLFRVVPWENSAAVEAQAEIAKEHILNAKIPDRLGKKLLAEMGELLDSNYFAVRPSFISDLNNSGHFSDLHVRGTANILESILRVWSRLYSPEELKKRVDEFQSGQMVPAGMILQQMINATASGYISIDAGHSHAHSLTKSNTAQIYSVWGVMKRGIEEVDTFEIDLSLHKTLRKEIGHKKHAHHHQLDGLQLKKLATNKQSAASLTEDQVEELMMIILQLHKRFVFPQKIEWSIEANKIYILSIYYQEQKSVTPHLPVKHSALALDILVMTSRANFSGVSSPRMKGIVFNADQIIRQLPEHPESGQSKNAYLIKDMISTSLLNLYHTFPFHQLIYRASHLDSLTLSRMRNGTEHETTEENPSFGYRGGLRAQRKSVILDLELDALTDFYKQTKQKIAITLPWTRTPSEIQWLKKHIYDPYFGSAPFLETWLECTTPENVLNIEKYLNIGIQGIIIDVDTLHAILHGIDPHNKDISNLYSIDYSLLQLLIAPLVQRAQSARVPVFVLVRQWRKEWGELAQALQVSGLIVQEKDIDICLQFNP